MENARKHQYWSENFQCRTTISSTESGDHYPCLMGGCLLDSLAYSMSGEHIVYVYGTATFFKQLSLIYTILCVWICYCSSENPT